MKEIMKNIHVLPTDKLSRLFYNVGGALLFTSYKNYNGVNIYITNSEEIKVGDWYFITESISKCESKYEANDLTDICKKIILTTDPQLIQDGVQPIDDNFLEWFVKNPSCEEIYVNKIESFDFEINKYVYNYKIIIPKEEPKQETLEEVAEKTRQESFMCCSLSQSIDYVTVGEREKLAFIKGAKWQQEQDKKLYSEEDMKKAFEDGQENMDYSEMYGWSSKLTTEEWFEQFKNK